MVGDGPKQPAYEIFSSNVDFSSLNFGSLSSVRGVEYGYPFKIVITVNIH